MPIISNRTDRPVLLAFNSGQTLRLSPRSTSEDVPDVEIANNAKVAKLAALNVITIADSQPKGRAARGAAGEDAGTRTERAAAPAAAAATTVAAKRETTSSKSAKRP